MSWGGVKAGGEKQIRGVEPAQGSARKSLEGRGVEAVAQLARAITVS